MCLSVCLSDVRGARSSLVEYENLPGSIIIVFPINYTYNLFKGTTLFDFNEIDTSVEKEAEK